MTVQVGDKIPSLELFIMGDGGPESIGSEDIFDGKRVALFGLPGAYTKTCSAQHLPGYVNNAEALNAKGVDAIVCLSVNDAWVMHAWGESQNAAGKVMMIGDGGLEFTRWAGLEVDLSAKGYGARCKRFSALVEDGTVKTLHFEDGGFGETSAERLLEDL
ncbi:MAG: peroxiredoxin [Rhodospirillaceae bacterium]|jgi:glutaredoxin/glutathione-dependent peroxiredoxin|nr:peroxiredoxin [Rhodospirillaceae bacterium]